MRREIIIASLAWAGVCFGLGCENRGDAPRLQGERATVKCYFALEDPSTLAATVTETPATVNGTETIYIRLAMDPKFVDNTYGANAIGWEDSKKGGHEFKELVGSDHEELMLYDKAGALKAHFKMDYISEVDDAGGYRSLGVTGGDGEMFVGDPSAIVAFTTSMDRNFNEYGYSQYTVDSPETDAQYTANSNTEKWEYLVIYEAWVDAEQFGEAGFGKAVVEYIHASPSKGLDNTIEVDEGDCPDDSWDDDNEVVNQDDGEDPSDEDDGPQPPVV